MVEAAARPMPRPKYNVRMRSSDAKKPSRDVLLPLFDMQYGSEVKAKNTVHGLGDFNAEIFAERMALYVEKVTRHMRDFSAGHRLERLIFALGGDMVEGDEIYGGIEWHLEMHPIEQAFQVHEHIAHAIVAIMRAGAEVGIREASILCVPGNHGKVGGKKAGDKPPSYSWDVLVFRLLKMALSNQPIKNFIVEPAGACFFDIRGNLFAMIHGDEVRGWGGLPFYGFTRYDAKMIRTANVIPDYVLLGHHHQPASIPIGFGEYLMSGNWVGATSLSKHVGSNTPSQFLYYVDDQYGVGDRAPIYLDKRRKPKATVHQTC
jgi:hypothetical protein